MMAGVSADEVDIADAKTIADWLVWSGKIPPAVEWIDNLAQQAAGEFNAASLGAMFR